MLQISLLFHWIVLLLQAKKTCFMKEFFIHHVFEIIIIVIAYAKKSMTQLSHGNRMVLNQREQTCCFCFL